MFCSSRTTFNVICFAFRYTSCISVEQIKCGYYIVTFEFVIYSFCCHWKIGSNYNFHVRLNCFWSATLTQPQLCSPVAFKGALVYSGQRVWSLQVLYYRKKKLKLKFSTNIEKYLDLISKCIKYFFVNILYKM